MTGDTVEEMAEDMLINAEFFVGGRLGVCALDMEEAAMQLLRERRLVGPKGCLTRLGVVEAKRAWKKYWEAP
jgi:hypothetical protein